MFRILVTYAQISSSVLSSAAIGDGNHVAPACRRPDIAAQFAIGQLSVQMFPTLFLTRVQVRRLALERLGG